MSCTRRGCTRGCTTECGGSCTGQCKNGCNNGCYGCTDQCKNGCGSRCGGCTGCSGKCDQLCADACKNGCGDTCDSGCKGGCKNGCGGSCKHGCGGCDTGCSSCTGSCSGGCLSSCSGKCQNTCKDQCGNQCKDGTTKNLSTFHINNLNKIEQEEITFIINAIKYEVTRRKKTPEEITVSVGESITSEKITSLIENLKKVNSSTNITIATTINKHTLKTEIDAILADLKTAWNEIIDPEMELLEKFE